MNILAIAVGYPVPLKFYGIIVILSIVLKSIPLMEFIFSKQLFSICRMIFNDGKILIDIIWIIDNLSRNLEFPRS